MAGGDPRDRLVVEQLTLTERAPGLGEDAVPGVLAPRRLSSSARRAVSWPWLSLANVLRRNLEHAKAELWNVLAVIDV